MRSNLSRPFIAAAVSLTSLVAASGTASAAPVGTQPGFAKAQIVVSGGTASVVRRTVFSTETFNTGVTVETHGVGEYTVTFADLGRDGGTAHVVPWATAHGGQPPICTVEEWFRATDDMEVSVRCFDPVTGTRTHGTRFDVWYSFMSLDGFGVPKAAYAWANQPTAASYQPDPFYVFSGTNAPQPTITRTAIGVYRVEFEESLDRSTPLVTAYGTVARFCHPSASAPSGVTNRVVTVRCFRPGGVAADSRFTLTVGSGDLLSGMSSGGRLQIRRPGVDGPITPATGNFNDVEGAGTNSYDRVDQGRWKVLFPGLDGVRENITAQAFTHRAVRCFPIGTYSDPLVYASAGVRTRCLSASTGVGVDARQWVTRTDRYALA